MPLLEVSGIDVFYGEVQTLWGVSLAVEQGEVVTIVGSNGAGKTTTIKTISGLLKPASGSITFNGKRIERLPAHEVLTHGIAQIPEGRRLWPEMSVRDNLEMGAYTPEARRHRKETLEWVHTLFPRLAEREKQLAGTMSGGEQQMCAIGRGLMSRPKLLMLDEPSLGLSPLLVSQVFNVIREINAAGVTVLLVEQNVRHALELASRAYVLESGRVALTGSSRELLNNPQVQSAYLGF